MATVRVVQAVMGYFVPFALLVAFLFFLEFSAELVTGVVASLVNDTFNTTFPTRPDFPGPLNLLNFAIGAFPSIWDIGTTLFWGSIEEFAFFGSILSIILASLTGVAFFRSISKDLEAISDKAGIKSTKRSRMTSYSKIEE